MYTVTYFTTVAKYQLLNLSVKKYKPSWLENNFLFGAWDNVLTLGVNETLLDTIPLSVSQHAGELDDDPNEHKKTPELLLSNDS